MATRARSGRHWAQCPRLRDNSERYGDQSSLWAPLGSIRDQRAMATRARSGRHWAHVRGYENSERYGDQSSLWAPLGSLSAATSNSERYGQSSLWAPLGSLSAATRQQ
ncbi:Hypothetical predicted protein [Octopus vulgaris]|uniref:Uncharacterized protein n=1 Tax=Octopus vulgaris TaxID=6645 RepID=A0AA36BI32_OCTVU|nr:Hypothetical predicted protein [Octopus vulgaris]